MTVRWGGSGQGANPGGNFDFGSTVRRGDGSIAPSNPDFRKPEQVADAYYRPGANRALSYLNNGVGFTPYQGNRVANLTGGQDAALNRMYSSGMSTPGYMQSARLAANDVGAGNAQIGNYYREINPRGYGLNHSQQIYLGVGDTNGLNGIQSDARGTFDAAQAGRMNASTDRLGRIFGDAQGSTYSEGGLGGIAGGGVGIQGGNVATGNLANLQGQAAQRAGGQGFLGSVTGGNQQVRGGNVNTSNLGALQRQAGQNTGGERYLSEAMRQGPSYAEKNLSGIARGDEINGGNPYFKEALANQLSDIQDRINLQFSGAGRYGSGAQTDVLTNELGQVATNALSQNYENERGRQLQANSMLDSQRQFGIGAELSAANSLNSLDMSQRAQQQGLAGQIAGIQGQNIDRSIGVQGQNLANRMSAANSNASIDLARRAQQQGLANNIAGIQGQNINRDIGVQSQNLANRMAAIGQMDAANQNARNQALSSANSILGADQFNINTALSGADRLASLGQQGINNRLSSAGGMASVGSQMQNAAMARAAGLTNRDSQNLSNRLSASALAPSLQQAELARINQALQAGTIRQGQRQDVINAEMARHNEAQNAPWDRLNAYMATTGATGGGGYQPQQQQQPQGPSTAQSILGGALTGAGIGSKFGPWGTLVGGIGGGALGLFG